MDECQNVIDYEEDENFETLNTDNNSTNEMVIILILLSSVLRMIKFVIKINSFYIQFRDNNIKIYSFVYCTNILSLLV